VKFAGKFCEKAVAGDADVAAHVTADFGFETLFNFESKFATVASINMSGRLR
jgi:hypothetical protein